MCLLTNYSKQMRKEWNKTATIKQNMKAMGLAYDSNKLFPLRQNIVILTLLAVGLIKDIGFLIADRTFERPGISCFI